MKPFAAQSLLFGRTYSFLCGFSESCLSSVLQFLLPHLSSSLPSQHTVLKVLSPLGLSFCIPFLGELIDQAATAINLVFYFVIPLKSPL